MRLLSMVVQEYLPVNWDSIHMVNCPRVAEMAYKIIKPMLGERIREKIRFHPTNSELHQHVDKALLTDEQDGTLDRSETQQSTEITLAANRLFSEIYTFAYGKS